MNKANPKHQQYLFTFTFSYFNIHSDNIHSERNALKVYSLLTCHRMIFLFEKSGIRKRGDKYWEEKDNDSKPDSIICDITPMLFCTEYFTNNRNRKGTLTRASKLSFIQLLLFHLMICGKDIAYELMFMDHIRIFVKRGICSEKYGGHVHIKHGKWTKHLSSYTIPWDLSLLPKNEDQTVSYFLLFYFINKYLKGNQKITHITLTKTLSFRR